MNGVMTEQEFFKLIRQHVCELQAANWIKLYKLELVDRDSLTYHLGLVNKEMADAIIWRTRRKELRND